MSRDAANAGAITFKRSGDLDLGNYDDATVGPAHRPALKVLIVDRYCDLPGVRSLASRTGRKMILLISLALLHPHFPDPSESRAPSLFALAPLLFVKLS